MRRLIAVIALSGLAGCSTYELAPTPSQAQAGVIAEYRQGLWSSLIERCQNGDRLYMLLHEKGAAIAVIPGGCAAPVKAELR